MAATLKKIEAALKTGKDPEPKRELFPGLDLKAPPVVINAVQTDALPPTEAAYYFASMPSLLNDRYAISNNSSRVEARLERPLKPEVAPEEDKHPALEKPKSTAYQGRKRPGKRQQANSSRDVSAEARESPARKVVEQPEEEPDVWCVCDRGYEEGDKMIECDGICKRWYHIECVNMTPQEFERLSKDKNGIWKCSYCCQGIPPPMPVKGQKMPAGSHAGNSEHAMGSASRGNSEPRKKKKIGK